jgi:signal transduction histidine kinase
MELGAETGVGIGGMRERVRQFGGTLEIAGSGNGRGTAITANLPVDRNSMNAKA